MDDDRGLLRGLTESVQKKIQGKGEKEGQTVIFKEKRKLK